MEKKPYLAVILIQVIYTGSFLINKAAFNHGMNNFIFTFYRQAAATVFLVPLAFLCERKTVPRLSFAIFCKIFLLSFFGITMSLDIYGLALEYTSASLASATTNCLPVITFFLALLLGGESEEHLPPIIKRWDKIARMESLKLRTIPGMAKLLGVVLSLAGALILAVYKGHRFQFLSHLHLLKNHGSIGGYADDHIAAGKTWIKGCFLMLLSNTFWGFWLVLQVFVIKEYPSKLRLTALQCFSSSVQSFAVAIALERNVEQWMLGWDVRLLAVAYNGFVVTGVTFYWQSWVIEKRGPVFLAMSTPLSLAMTTVASALLLGEVIRLGSLLGGLLLVGGLYVFLWGKRREQPLEDSLKQTPANV